MPETAKPKNKVILVLCTGFFALCGVHRCFLGQILLGMVQGFTLGGLGIWAFVDWTCVMGNALQNATSIDLVGMKAEFEPSTVDWAFWIAMSLIVSTPMFEPSKASKAARARAHKVDEVQDQPYILVD